MVLREDGLALGARDGIANFGLDAFQGLLGRLNGKSEETLRREEDVRREVHLKMRRERRVGSILFLSSGYLRLDEENAKRTADKAIKSVERKVSSRNPRHEEKTQLESPQDLAFQSKNTKRKRKISAGKEMKESNEAEINATEAETPLEMVKSERKQKKSANTEKKRKLDTTEDTGETGTKSKKRKSKSIQLDDARATRDPQVTVEVDDEKRERREKRAERRKERAEKRARKEEKRMKKLKVSSGTLHKDARIEPGREGKQSESRAQDPTSILKDKASSSATQAHPPTTAIRARGRHLIRQKYIQHKNMAAVDQTALNEVSCATHAQREREANGVQIFMIKSQA